METGFGADFGAVRVHSGGDAVAMSRELRAQAFTHGKDIFFNSGKFEPDTVRGRTPLAHELTHVVQQGAAEQKVPEAKIAENNAKREQAPPEPTDKQALKVEDATLAVSLDVIQLERLAVVLQTVPVGATASEAAVVEGCPQDNAV